MLEAVGNSFTMGVDTVDDAMNNDIDFDLDEMNKFKRHGLQNRCKT